MASSAAGAGPASTKEQAEAKFDLGIALALARWPALSLAVQNLWGGPDSVEKRDWFAGAISDLFANTPDGVDSQYLEEFMLQVMADEFEVHIEDESGEEVADRIVALRQDTLERDFKAVDEMMAQWEEKRSRGEDRVAARFVEQEGEDGSDDESSEAEDDDMAMDEAPDLVPARPARERTPPEVDEDGFTKVATKKKR